MAHPFAAQLRTASDRLQQAALHTAISLLRGISPVAASNTGGWLARHIGPHLAVSRIANDNLAQALPHLAAAERAQVIARVWDNLGRTAAELPHLASFHRTPSGPGWEIHGEEHVAALLHARQPALFFSGHLGNWEMILPIAASLGVNIAGAYRAASNSWANTAIQAMRQRALGPHVSMFAKGAPGARAAMLHMKAGGSLGMLVDQKMNDGIAVPFFGRPAMTAPALAQFALRFALPIVPVRVVRLAPGRFRMICEAPLAVPRTGERAADIRSITLAVNATLERWIREDPGCWLWLHKRWPKQDNR